MDEMNETMDAVLESAWEDDSAPAAEEEPAQEETDGAPGKAEGFAGERRSAGTSELSPTGGSEGCEGRDDELFTLKNRDETKQVTRDELVAMAQKGWDYDTVRAERDQLRQYRQETGPALEMVRAEAQRKGMTVPDYLDHCRRQDLAQSGPGNPAPQQPNVLIQRIKQNARRQDMERFVQTYPTVRAESIPKEVWGQVARGVPLVSAYAMHENQQLKVQLAAERQNTANRLRTPGALGANSGVELDELDRMWAEDD